MRIHKNELISGIPIIKIRNFFKSLGEIREFTYPELKKHLCLNKSETDTLISELISNNFIEPYNNIYSITLKGNAFSIARCVPPINREKADKIFQEFMQRVEEVNNNDFYLYRVCKLFLFGSYLNIDNPDYGDIDIAFDLELKTKDYHVFLESNKKLVQEAREKGKIFSSYLDEVFYSFNLVLLKLKNRNRYISLHSVEDTISNIAESKQIYP